MKLNSLCRQLHFLSMRGLSALALIAFSLALAGIAHPQQQATPKTAAKPGTPGTNQGSSASKLALADGLWSGRADFADESAPNGDGHLIFSFTVKNNSMTGEGEIPFHFACTVSGRALSSEMKKSMEKSDPGSKVTLVVPDQATGSISATGLLTRDFSKITHVPGGNRFRGVFAAADARRKYSVTVDGVFATATHASGSVTVRTSSCKGATVYRWEADAQASVPAP